MISNFHMESDMSSVMEPTLALGAKLIMLSVCLEKGRSRTTKYIPKGMTVTSVPLLPLVMNIDTLRCSKDNKCNL